jgi:hypothetical protein
MIPGGCFCQKKVSPAMMPDAAGLAARLEPAVSITREFSPAGDSKQSATQRLAVIRAVFFTRCPLSRA